MRMTFLGAAMVLLSASSSIVVGQSAYDSTQSVSLAGRQFTLIPAEVVKSLNIARGPRPQANAPIISFYWHCEEREWEAPDGSKHTTESCSPSFVWCVNEGSCWDQSG